MTLFDGLEKILPRDLRDRVAHAQLELTPHRGERVLLRDRHELILAIAHLDDPAQKQTLDQLRQLLPDWQSHLPVPIAEGEAAGRHVWLRAYTPGRSLHDEVGARPLGEIARDGARLLGQLHAACAESTRLERERLRTWIDEPLAILESTVGLERHRFEEARQSLTICAALENVTLPFAPHHGDYQLTNLIHGDDGSLVVIDWELSLGKAPAAMDLIHYLIGLGVSGHGHGFGRSVREALDPRSQPGALAHELWSAHRSELPVDDSLVEALWALTILHDAAHFARRAPHLFDRARQADMLGALAYVAERAQVG